jgi:hypothetical protein
MFSSYIYIYMYELNESSKYVQAEGIQKLMFFLKMPSNFIYLPICGD